MTLDIACCKACGRPYHVPYVPGILAPVIVRALQKRPAGLTMMQLGEAVYGHCEWPKSWNRSLSTRICTLNRKLKPYGWQIKRVQGRAECYDSVFQLVGVQP